MKLILHDGESIINEISDIHPVLVSSDTVTYKTKVGEVYEEETLKGVDLNMIVVPDEASYDSLEEAHSYDESSLFKSKESTAKEEIEMLRKRLNETENATMMLMDFTMMGGL